MTISRFCLRPILPSAALMLALAGHPVMAQDARFDAACVPRLTSMEQRLYQKADEGTDALRQFIFIRRAILQVDIYETAMWAASLSQARAACFKNVSAMGVQ